MQQHLTAVELENNRLSYPRYIILTGSRIFVEEKNVRNWLFSSRALLVRVWFIDRRVGYADYRPIYGQLTSSLAYAWISPLLRGTWGPRWRRRFRAHISRVTSLRIFHAMLRSWSHLLRPSMICYWLLSLCIIIMQCCNGWNGH